MAVEVAGHLVCVVTMRRLVTVLSAWLWACGDNGIVPADADWTAPPFRPAPHAPMPPVLPHAGIVLSEVQLVTLTFDDYPARAQVEAFGDVIVQSPWYQDVGMEYGVHAGAQVQKLGLGPTPTSITRGDIVSRVKQLITAGLAPRPTSSGNQLLYLVYVPPAVTRGPELEGLHGYHQMSTLDGVRFAIAVVLDDGSGLASTTSTAAGQLINAATNPYDPPMDGYYTDPPMTDPWSLVHGEVADLCDGEDPVLEGGFTVPRVYSSIAATAGAFPCKPVMANDAWTDVSPDSTKMQVIPRGGSVTFKLTGWSTQELPDWTLRTQVADFSGLTEAEMRPELSDDMINNSTSVLLTLHAPPTAESGAACGVYVLSGANVRPWAVGFIVQ